MREGFLLQIERRRENWFVGQTGSNDHSFVLETIEFNLISTVKIQIPDTRKRVIHLTEIGEHDRKIDKEEHYHGENHRK